MTGKQPHKNICEAIHKELNRRTVNGATTFHESTAENAVVTFVELLPVTSDIATVV